MSEYQRGYSDGIRFEKNKNNRNNYNYILDELHEIYYNLKTYPYPHDEAAHDRLMKLCEYLLNK